MEMILSQHIRLRGVVQGVGMRPTVWRIATDIGLRGDVCNDGEGVLIRVCGTERQLREFVTRLQLQPPAMARIDAIEIRSLEQTIVHAAFRIRPSEPGPIATAVPADAATCQSCLNEIFDANDRRYRYPFTNCTQCGPRLSIMKGIPYDRANTSMDVFIQCPQCQSEYEYPCHRRYHAQPNACPHCGPQLWLENNLGQQIPATPSTDAIGLAAQYLKNGSIVAIKGIGGFHLACDATNESTIAELRRRKNRIAKPFALMVRDMDIIARYATFAASEREMLQSYAAPVVILDRLPHTEPHLPAAVAPGQNSLGFMLPHSPLHHLLLQEFEHPLVMTSGNGSQEPPCLTNDEAHQRLSGIADYFLLHNREIQNRVDDSVVRLAFRRPRVLRRGRGLTPSSVPLHPQLHTSTKILAMGAELKNTFCLIQRGRAVLSPHIGDLEDVATRQDYQHQLELFQRLYDFSPDVIVVDTHPNYVSTQLGHQLAISKGIPVVSVLHHHAHIAAVMAEAGLGPDIQVLGIALDGLGMGERGELWGGEILKVDYRSCEKLGGLPAIPLPGGSQAMREPWRNTLAHLLQIAEMPQLRQDFGELEILDYLEQKPLRNLQIMMAKNINSPPASSAGRLFDAVAAALDIARNQAHYEGQAAMEMEAMAAPHMTQEIDNAYEINEAGNSFDLASLWKSILGDLQAQVSAASIAARFHHGFANGIVNLAARLAIEQGLSHIVLGGGVFQNRLLLEAVATQLEEREFIVHIPQNIPLNDGGISLGQAVVGLAMTQ